MGRSRRTRCCSPCWRSCGPAQTVKASALRDGTTAGAAALALIDGGRLPTIGLKLAEVTPAAIAGLGDYQHGGRWL